MRSNPPDSAFFSNVQFPWLELICQMTASSEFWHRQFISLFVLGTFWCFSDSIKTTNVLQEIVSLLMDSEGCQAFHMPKLSAKVACVQTVLDMTFIRLRCLFRSKLFPAMLLRNIKTFWIKRRKVICGIFSKRNRIPRSERGMVSLFKQECLVWSA